MPTRTISISDDAYNRLSCFKESNESFSDVIVRLTGKVDLLDFAGVLTDDEASSMEKRIKAGRSSSRKRAERLRSGILG